MSKMVKTLVIAGVITSILSGCMMDPSIDLPIPSDSALSTTSQCPDQEGITSQDQESTDVIKGTSFDRGVNIINKYLDSNTNIMVSPMSIDMALSMVANIVNDQSKSNIEQFLGSSIEDLNNKSSDLIRETKLTNNTPTGFLKLANSLWIREGLADNLSKEAFETFDMYYNSNINEVESGDAQKINNWVSENTDGMITSIIQDIPESFESMIINAIYFNDTWMDPFDTNNTQTENFTKSDGSKVDVEMMHGTADSYMRNAEYQAFRKYYTNGYSFIGIVPFSDGPLNIESINLNTLLESETFEYETLVSMPKFKFDYSISMEEYLNSVRLGELFSAGTVTGLVDGESLTVNNIVHKTAIDMQESGTKAAAVTGVMVDSSAMVEEREIQNVDLNKPFIFVIAESNENIAFMGVVNNPVY